MAFESKYGITDLKTTKDKEILSLSLECDEDDDDEIDPKQITFAQMLYVPNKDKFEHYHIELTEAACLEMYEWLGKYLQYKGLTAYTSAAGTPLVET
jgi:hypothetical protein